MFISHPWIAYAYAMTTLIAVYYLAVVAIFYRREFFNALQRLQGAGRKPRPPSGDEQTGSTSFSAALQTEPDDVLIAGRRPEDQLVSTGSVHRLPAELCAMIQEAHQKQYGKRDLILLLQMVLTEYSATRHTPFGLIINDLIQGECAKYGSIHLSENDLRELWQV